MGGYAGAWLKISKETEVRTRAGDFATLFALHKLVRLVMSSIPNAYNFRSDNTTKSKVRNNLIPYIRRMIQQIAEILSESIARASHNYRKDLYAIGVRLGVIDPIHIVQFMIWNSDKGTELPSGGLREYLGFGFREGETYAHLEIGRFVCFVNKIIETIEEKYNVKDSQIHLLTRMEESKDQVKKFVKDLFEKLKEEGNFPNPKLHDNE